MRLSPFLYIYTEYVLFTVFDELIMLDVLSPQLIKMVPRVVVTENAVIVVISVGVVKFQNPPDEEA